MSTKKQRREFRKKAEDLICRLGGRRSNTQDDSMGYSWVLPTKCGLLFLDIDDHEYKPSVGTVFTRFENTERALTWSKTNGFGMPDCSRVGKWNHHYFEKYWTLNGAIDSLTYCLQQVCE